MRSARHRPPDPCGRTVARLTGTGPVPGGLYLLAHDDVTGSRAASAAGGGRQRPQWPNATCLVLAPLPTAVPCARLHARLVLAEWQLTELRDTIELVVSELMTNAVAASLAIPGRPPVRLDLRGDGTEVLVTVQDASPQPPVPQDAPGDAEAGRGLLLVHELSRAWGWTPAPPGKAVWATVS